MTVICESGCYEAHRFFFSHQALFVIQQFSLFSLVPVTLGQFILPDASDIYSTASWAASLWVLSVTQKMKMASCCLSLFVKSTTREAA